MNGPPHSYGHGSMFFRPATQRVLSFLVDSTGAYGLQITAATGVNKDVVYQLLRRLKAAGAVSAVNEVGDPEQLGRALRCYYSLTEPTARLLRLCEPST
jgi:DNA-binding transcriptional ArsR family regulator